jgi:ketosteroid isomerase-like protein
MDSNKLYDLERVNVEIHQTLDPNVVVIELSIEGKLRSNSKPIEIQSSVAFVSFEGDKIIRYRDYPNSAGVAEAIGLLAEYVASIGK